MLNSIIQDLIHQKVSKAENEEGHAILSLISLVEKDGKYEAKVKSSTKAGYKTGRGVANVKEDAIKKAVQSALGL